MCSRAVTFCLRSPIPEPAWTPETQAQIFEPFFTTKEQGKGTGLGLATVYGVVKQSGGFIWVYSEVGKGTSFKIYLPRVDQPADKVRMTCTSRKRPRGTETILLAEDEQDVREVAREFLESAGYTVLEAASGAEAMQTAAQYPGNIDLLVTDMVMPGMTGQRLAVTTSRTAAQAYGVIYMSGYSEHAAAEAAQNPIQAPGCLPSPSTATPFYEPFATSFLRTEILDGRLD